MVSPALPAFLVGVVVAPLAVKVLKPVVRGVIRTTVGAGLELRKMGARAGERLRNLTAEVMSAKPAGENARPGGTAH